MALPEFKYRNDEFEHIHEFIEECEIFAGRINDVIMRGGFFDAFGKDIAFEMRVSNARNHLQNLVSAYIRTRKNLDLSDSFKEKEKIQSEERSRKIAEYEARQIELRK